MLNVVSDGFHVEVEGGEGVADSSAPGILQVRILEWVAMPFSRGSSQPRD